MANPIHKKQYDLIFSLGGNCAAAHALRYRHLRKVSLPLDWVFIRSEYPIKMLAQCFKDDFKHFFLKENLLLLPAKKENQHANYLQYQDTYTQYLWVNLLEQKVDVPGYYEQVKAKIDARLARLQRLIKTSKSVLCLLSVDCPVSTQTIEDLRLVLQAKFKGVSFDFVVLCFGADKEQTLSQPHLTRYHFMRKLTGEDFHSTTAQWDFLDKVTLSKRHFGRWAKKWNKLCGWLCRLTGSKNTEEKRNLLDD